mmetsp:Transcript_13613/g.31400  ORF Transcript_13613/g.31400 Transcript_13613/m.31400 type:complete len:464 (+) Transcript_13613:1831-3222(+)
MLHVDGASSIASGGLALTALKISEGRHHLDRGLATLAVADGVGEEVEGSDTGVVNHGVLLAALGNGTQVLLEASVVALSADCAVAADAAREHGLEVDVLPVAAPRHPRVHAGQDCPIADAGVVGGRGRGGQAGGRVGAASSLAECVGCRALAPNLVEVCTAPGAADRRGLEVVAGTVSLAVAQTPLEHRQNGVAHKRGVGGSEGAVRRSAVAHHVRLDILLLHVLEHRQAPGGRVLGLWGAERDLHVGGEVACAVPGNGGLGQRDLVAAVAAGDGAFGQDSQALRGHAGDVGETPGIHQDLQDGRLGDMGAPVELGVDLHRDAATQVLGHFAVRVRDPILDRSRSLEAGGDSTGQLRDLDGNHHSGRALSVDLDNIAGPKGGDGDGFRCNPCNPSKEVNKLFHDDFPDHLLSRGLSEHSHQERGLVPRRTHGILEVRPSRAGRLQGQRALGGSDLQHGAHVVG